MLEIKTKFLQLVYLLVLVSIGFKCGDEKSFNDTTSLKEAYFLNTKLFFEIIQTIKNYPQFNSIIRRTEDKIPSIKRYNQSFNIWANYLIIFEEKNITILVPSSYSENEYSFWERDFENIRETYSNQDLKSFLKNRINFSDFRKLISFIIRFDLFSIRVSPNKGIIYLENFYKKGIYYIINDANEIPDLSPNTKIEKIGDNIFFYSD